MGGLGSGRWDGHAPKRLVEDSLVLDAAALERLGAIGYRPMRGHLVWRSRATGADCAAVAFATALDREPGPRPVLRYPAPGAGRRGRSSRRSLSRRRGKASTARSGS